MKSLPLRILLILTLILASSPLALAQGDASSESAPASAKTEELRASIAALETIHAELFEAMESVYAMRVALKVPEKGVDHLTHAEALSTLDIFQGYKNELLKVFDIVTNEAENARKDRSLYQAILNFEAAWGESDAKALEQEDKELYSKSMAVRRRFAWALGGSTSLWPRLLSESGIEKELSDKDREHLLILPDALNKDIQSPQIEAKANQQLAIDPGPDFLIQMQLAIDPIERIANRLADRVEDLELSRISKIDRPNGGSAGGKDEPTLDELQLPPHQRTQLRIERYEYYREEILEEFQSAYQRLARSGQELGAKFGIGQILGETRKLSEELSHEVNERIKDAMAEVGRSDKRSLIELEAYLSKSVVDLQASKEASAAGKVLKTAYLKARVQRIETLKDTIRNLRSNFLVRRKTVERQIDTLIWTEGSIADFEARWKDQAIEFYGMAAFWVVAILFAAWLLIRIVKLLARRIVRRFNAEHDDISADTEARAKTISTAFTGTIAAAIWVVALLMVLGRFGIDYKPLLVATGGVGLAIGFGAQSLVKDFFSGFFILLENQFVVGDVITISGKTGTVDEINLRTTRMRSLDGTFHVVPNGQISMVSNMTHKWSRMVVVISAGYREDPDTVRAIVNRVGKEMFEDEAWKDRLLEAPVVLGLDNLNASSIDFKVVGRTKSGEQWGAEREFRRRVKIQFDLEDIEIPFQYVNYVETKPETSRVLKSPTPSIRKAINEDLEEVPDEGAAKRQAEKQKEAAEASNDSPLAETTKPAESSGESDKERK